MEQQPVYGRLTDLKTGVVTSVLLGQCDAGVKSVESQDRSDVMARPQAGDRWTAMFHLTVYDDRWRQLDQRVFVGTTDEAADELKEEFLELFPEFLGRDRQKTPEFWVQKRRELNTGSPPRATVRATCPLKGERIVTMERYSSFRKED